MLDIIGSKKRLQILKVLSREDRYVSQIMDLADMDGKRAKHHLDELEEKDLIESYMDGRRKYYTLKKEIHLEITPPPEGRFLVYTSE